MERYEEFCQRNLALLLNGSTKEAWEPHCSLKAVSSLCFHGRALLPPLLSTEQRREAREHRQRAIQLELDRQTHQRSCLLARAQDVLKQAEVSRGVWLCTQVHKVPDRETPDQPSSPHSFSPKPETVNGYTLVTDSPGLPKELVGVPALKQPTTPQTETPLNGYMGKKELGEKEVRSEEEEEEDMSLDSLLKRSRDYVEREKSRRTSEVTCRVTHTPPPDSLSDKENEGRSPLADVGVEFGFSLRHSPVEPPRVPIERQVVCDPDSHQTSSLSPSLPDPYVHMPSPELSLSPHQHRRRPRPVSTGNIHISFPIVPTDLIPRSPGRSGEGASMAAWAEAFSGGVRSSDHWGLVGSDSGGNGSGCNSRRSSHCGTSPVQDISGPASISGPGLMGHHDHMASGFRRRSHTLDSQPCSPHSASRVELIDRSQERVPRFMAGVARLPPGRRNPATPLNHSYEVENPSPSMLRPHVASERGKPRVEGSATQEPNTGRISPIGISNVPDQQDNKTEEVHWRMQALENMQRRLEEEHALQMSLLLAEQEKEQQHLRQELDEKERRLKEQGADRPLSADVGGRDRRSMSDSYPAVTSSYPGLSPAHTPLERSPGHSIGYPSPFSSRVSSPSVQPPSYLFGSPLGISKPRARHSQVLSAEQQRALCRLGAIIRGYLTRRLLQTEKVKQLRQTVQDTQEFIHCFQTEQPQRKGCTSAQDNLLQERVRAQLRAALYDVHDIFFVMPLVERLALLQQDRELRAERKLREMEKTRGPKDRVALSTATQRSLDRKKRFGESPCQTRKISQKPKSPTTNRILKPSQGQNAPIPGQLSRQGSWYRKTPEERVRLADSLKKQHSLG